MYSKREQKRHYFISYCNYCSMGVNFVVKWIMKSQTNKTLYCVFPSNAIYHSLFKKIAFPLTRKHFLCKTINGTNIHYFRILYEFNCLMLQNMLLWLQCCKERRKVIIHARSKERKQTKVLCKHNFQSVTFNIDITYNHRTLMLYLNFMGQYITFVVI